MQKQHRILIVDDEPPLRRALRTSLAAAGFLVHEAGSGEDAVVEFPGHSCDLVLLDINMPGIGGIETCRRLRALAPDAAIVMLTVKDSEEDKVRALDAGADDFVTKPYRLRELAARIRAVLRRTQRTGAPAKRMFQVGDLEVDLERRLLKKNGAEIHLSPTEFDLMAFFVQHQGEPIMHARLLRTVWGPEYGGETEYLRSYVRSLRKKIERDPAHPEYLLTEPWVGYRFYNPVEDQSESVDAAARGPYGLQNR
jgi:two-component system KDP operon response regulator KdpE